MTTFNIGAQNAASIQNVGGDLVIEGDLQAAATWQTVELRAAIDEVRKRVAELELAPPVRAPTERALGAATVEAAADEPDRSRLGELLRTVVRTLDAAGALRDAVTLVEALRRAALLLGPVAPAVLALL
jgi:hypothetical protein